jgi:hypothetical protein
MGGRVAIMTLLLALPSGCPLRSEPRCNDERQ